MVNGFNSSFYLIYIKAIVHPDGPQYITKMSPVHLTFDAPPPPHPRSKLHRKMDANEENFHILRRKQLPPIIQRISNNQ